MVEEFDSYLQEQEHRRAVSPLFMELTERFPRALVITAEFDPLRDEGRAYVERLHATGLMAAYRQMPGMIYACLNLPDLIPEVCTESYATLARFLNDGA